MKKIIQTDKAPKAIGPYSQAVVHNRIAYLSGQIAIDPVSGEIVQGDVTAQTERVLDNLSAVLAACGSSLADVLKTTVYLKDISDFAAMNAVYARYFTENPPARATVQAARLPKDALVEIDATAIAD